MSESVLGRQRARIARLLEDKVLRRLLTHSSWMVASQLGTSVLGLVQVALLSRLLGKQGYGSLVLISTAALTVRQLINVRVWEWTTTSFAAALARKDAALAALSVKAGLATSALINVLAFALLALCAPLVERELLKGQASFSLVLLYGATFAGTWAHDTCFSALRAAHEFRFLALQGLVVAAARVMAFGAIVWFSRSLSLLILSYALFELAMGSWMLRKTASVFNRLFGTSLWRVRTPGLLVALRQNKKLLLFGSVLDTLKLAAGRGDVLLLGYLATPSTVAVYQAANNFIEGVNRMVAPVSLVLFSDLARYAAQGDASGVLRILRRTWLLGAVLGVSLSFLLFVFAKVLIGVTYGDAYASGARVLRILALVPLWLSVLWMQPVFASIGKPEWTVEVVAVAIAIKVALLFMLVPRFAELGLAASNAIYSLIPVLLGPLYVARVRRHVRQPAFKSVPEGYEPAPRAAG